MTFSVTNTFTNGTNANADEVNQNFTDIEDVMNHTSTTYQLLTQVAPIGVICAWAKSISGVPSLPTGWVECNGQVLSDAGSPLNGQTIPNLNASGGGTQRFLRGSTTSGTTGGADSVSHDHTSGGSNATVTAIPGSGGFTHSGSSINGTTSTTTSTLPSYYEVVWIMRVK